MSTFSPTKPEQTALTAGSRYELITRLAAGGMATVHVGRVRGAIGFWRLCAIKVPHPHLMEDVAFRRMFVEEARLASKLHHPNVVPVLDVEMSDDRLFLVMDYIEGASLSELTSASDEHLPPRVAIRIALDACAGLAAAHALADPSGKPLDLVHRDVSPQNILTGVDGMSRLTDFGIAKSVQSGATTTTGALKGKLSYMAPEYVGGRPPDARCDVFGLGVVVWELLAGRRLFRGENEGETLRRITEAEVPPLSGVAPWIDSILDPVLASALSRDPDERFMTAKAFGNALEIAASKVGLVGTWSEVGEEVQRRVGDRLEKRRKTIQDKIGPDVAPPSGRPTVPTPQAVASAKERLAKTVNDPETAQTTAEPIVVQEHSTLGGSGMSRAPTPPQTNRKVLWILGAAAMVAGGVAAALVASSSPSGVTEPTRDARDTTFAPPIVVPADPTPAVNAGRPADPREASTSAPTSSASAPSPQASSAPSARASASASAKVKPSLGAPPLPPASDRSLPTASVAPTNALPPNPY